MQKNRQKGKGKIRKMKLPKKLHINNVVKTVKRSKRIREGNLTDMMVGIFPFEKYKDRKFEIIFKEILEDAGQRFQYLFLIATTLIREEKYKERAKEILRNAEKYVKTEEDREMMEEAKIEYKL